MLWGAPNNFDACCPTLPGSCGAQSEFVLDDVAPTDGRLDPTRECYSYLFGCLGPDVLGKMVAYDTRSVGECPADFNLDGFVTGDDFDLFVLVFVNSNPTADFNLDGFVTGDDFDAFVLAFEAGC